MSRVQSSVPLKSNAFSMPVPVITQTAAPSVTGDGDDMFCLRWTLLPPLTGRFQVTAPELRSTLHSSSSPCDGCSATLRKMVSFQTMGVAPLRLGMASFQATFSVWVQVLVSPRSRLTPFNSGPRHCGQLSAKSVTVVSDATRKLKQTVRRMGSPPSGNANSGLGTRGSGFGLWALGFGRIRKNPETAPPSSRPPLMLGTTRCPALSHSRFQVELQRSTVTSS